jgi:hypothetical protein
MVGVIEMMGLQTSEETDEEKYENGVRWAVEFGDHRLMRVISKKNPERMLAAVLKMHPTHASYVAQWCPELDFGKLQAHVLTSDSEAVIRDFARLKQSNITHLMARAFELLSAQKDRNYPRSALNWIYVRDANEERYATILEFLKQHKENAAIREMHHKLPSLDRLATACWAIRHESQMFYQMLQENLISTTDAEDIVVDSPNPQHWLSFAVNCSQANIPRLEERMLFDGREPYISDFQQRFGARGSGLIENFKTVQDIMES